MLLGIAVILVLGISAQWLAWRLRLPSILLLLLFGFLAGPVCGYATARWLGPGQTLHLDPDALFGASLLPVVSLSVALILFEGGLSLNVRDLAKVGGVVWDLLSVGALTSWIVSAAAAYWLIGLDLRLAVLLGAILVVTGPTVIGPLLRHVRPAGQVGPILHWEGITIDPIGATFAVVVFEMLSLSSADHAAQPLLVRVLMTLLVGCVAGAAAAGVLVVALRRFWIPDHLHTPSTLMLVVAALQGSELIQPESGLFAVVVMGIVLANQSAAPVRHIVEFKEALSVLLVSGLFILLAARIELSFFRHLSGRSALFVLVLILVGRPLAVLLSTLRSDLRWRERVFLAWMAPRGIVAAAVASVFALRLSKAGMAEAELLVPLTFLVIAATVIVYASTAGLLARALGLAKPSAQGFLLVGAHGAARVIAAALRREKYSVLLVDTNPQNVAAAQAAGLPAVVANVLSPAVSDQVELGGIGKLLALTASAEVNSLAALHFAKIFGRAAVFQLDPGDGDEPVTAAPARQRYHQPGWQGRFLFTRGLTFRRLAELVEQGAVAETVQLTDGFDFEGFKRRRHGADTVPLFLLDGAAGITVLTADAMPAPRPDQALIRLVVPTPIAAPGTREAA